MLTIHRYIIKNVSQRLIAEPGLGSIFPKDVQYGHGQGSMKAFLHIKFRQVDPGLHGSRLEKKKSNNCDFTTS